MKILPLKSIVVVAAFHLSLAANAHQVVLQPGESYSTDYDEAVTVYCRQNQIKKSGAKCLIEKFNVNEVPRYRIFMDQLVAGEFEDFNTALNHLVRMRQQGICR